MPFKKGDIVTFKPFNKYSKIQYNAITRSKYNDTFHKQNQYGTFTIHKIENEFFVYLKEALDLGTVDEERLQMGFKLPDNLFEI